MAIMFQRQLSAIAQALGCIVQHPLPLPSPGSSADLNSRICSFLPKETSKSHYSVGPKCTPPSPQQDPLLCGPNSVSISYRITPPAPQRFQDMSPLAPNHAASAQDEIRLVQGG